MRYHKRSISMLPGRYDTGTAEIADSNALIKVPGSIAEFYSLKDSVRILNDFSNSDTGYPLSGIRVTKDGVKELAVFKMENQGVCEWAFPLNSGDNPPVLVSIDGGVWEIAANTFSEYIYSCIWDSINVLQCKSVIMAQLDPSVMPELNLSSKDFNQEIETYSWPGRKNQRYVHGSSGILTWINDGQVDLFIGNSDLDSLKTTIEFISKSENIFKSLYSNDENGIAMLRSVGQKICPTR